MTQATSNIDNKGHSHDLPGQDVTTTIHHHQTTTTRPGIQDPSADLGEKSWRSESNQSSEAGDTFNEKLPAFDETYTSSTKRPELGLRLTSTASSTAAAAPFAGPFSFDLLHTHEHAQSSSVPSQRRPRTLSDASTVPSLRQIPSNLATVSRVSTDAHGNTYPEGGAQAWLCVLGSFCGCMGALGLMNTIGTFQAYISTHQLAGQSESTIGWIFGIYAFLAFFCGIEIGPVFDAKGPRWLLLSGTICILATYLLLGICEKYWHFLVVFGILGGVGTSLVFTPAIASVGHWFLRKRGQCTGLAAVGGSMGGIVYPLALQALFPKIGFAWSTRVLALINFVLLVIANLCIKGRLPPRKATKEAIMPDFRIFRDPVFSLVTLGVFFIEWGLFVPLSYITSYSLHKGIDSKLAYQLVAILNAGSCFGRYFPGLGADIIGRFNSLTLTVMLAMVSTLAMWLPAGGSTGVVIAYAFVFGFASGAGISLTPVCVGQLCKVENYGRYYATCYTLVSFACLTGIPIAGQLITACGGEYWGLIVFTGASYTASSITFILARGIGAGWSIKTIF